MQIIAFLIFCGLLVGILGVCVYLARSQKPKGPKGQHYGSWSNVLGPQFRGEAFDVGEKLNSEIAEGQHQSRRTRRAGRARSRQR